MTPVTGAAAGLVSQRVRGPGQLETAHAEVCPAAGSVSVLDIKAAA